MGREIVLLLLFFGVSYAYNAQNVDLSSVIHMKNRGSNNLFGHSVAVPSGSTSRRYVYVGAPLDDIHGNVFGCWINGANLNKQEVNCNKADVDGMTSKDNRNLFGMTVTAMNGKVVSCAPFEPVDTGFKFGGMYPFYSRNGKFLFNF